jgi:DNA sulfur modification protein DndC
VPAVSSVQGSMPSGAPFAPPSLSSNAGPVRLGRLVARYPDRELAEFFVGSQRTLDRVYQRNFTRWVLPFSGGKDSTLTVLLAVDYLLRHRYAPKLVVVYADTLQEIPQMRKAAEVMLQHLRELAASTGLDLEAQTVVPAVKDRFWVKMIGRGYPPPGPIFRWCTDRLKIWPTKPYVFTGEKTAVMTGVRLGESTHRTGKLMATCTTGGECGQDKWMSQDTGNSTVAYFAPILQWRVCKVWDFLHFIAPAAGWPTQDVFELYGDTNLRFGCWNCSLVTRDRAAENLMEREPASGVKELHDLRDFMITESRKPENRLMRNGHMGPLSLELRKALLRRLREAERKTGLELISKEELELIERTWLEQRDVIRSLPRAG